MKIRLITAALLSTLLIAACGGSAPQTPPEVATDTPALATPTEIPSTATTAPETETSAPANETPAPETPAANGSGISYANDIFPILQNSCNKCHGIEKVKEGLDMTTYEGLMKGSFDEVVVTPGNADDSILVDLIVKGKMPKRGDKLTQDQIQLIIDWINQGALNN